MNVVPLSRSRALASRVRRMLDKEEFAVHGAILADLIAHWLVKEHRAEYRDQLLGVVIESARGMAKVEGRRGISDTSL